ncbi:YcaO-like family protein [Saccharibacillus alkalitolerans]|uniref:YcaO domain-containing protein n=1 Tax=Saccharibacillus alkalitolerans TaxID=2705290 RepID=A0ABX0F5P2_9BACL|nr:YcaO-like family protein [Saccharibacillus alkalitolerans]NGZ75304.1 hypothetical protein [Saccharibacillus alkalitolerans]
MSTVREERMFNKVREMVVVSEAEGWNGYIASRLADNTEFEIEEWDEGGLGRLDLDMTRALAESAGPETYGVYDLIGKRIEIRSLLDHAPLDTRAAGADEPDDSGSVTFEQFRSRDFRSVVEAIEPYRSSLVHPLFGIFKGHYRGIADSMPLIAFDARLGTRSYDAYGRSSSYEESYYTGLLEALERFHGAAPQNADFIRMSESELEEEGTRYVPMRHFCRYTEKQYGMSAFAFGRYSPEKRIKWRKAYDYGQSCEVLVPEQIAYFSSEQLDRFDPEPRYVAETSNGTAIGSSWEEAAVASLMEVIERDAFLVHWYTKSSPVRLEGAERYSDPEIRLMIAYLEAMDYRTHLFDITLDSGIPAYWVLLEYRGEDPDCLAYYTAAGASPNPVSAIRSALVEASTSIKVFKAYMYAKYSKEELEELQRDYANVSRLEDHLYLYSSSAMKEHLLFALETERTEELERNVVRRRLGNGEKLGRRELLDRLLKPLLPNHPEIYISDLSQKFLGEMGLSCTKIHIPSMQNIGFGMQYQNINLERLEQATRLNGLDGNMRLADSIPHPFP